MVEKIQNKQLQNYFTTVNDFVDKYAKFVKAPGVVIYTALSRHADVECKAFPGIRHLAKEMGVSFGYAQKGVKLLQKWNIVGIKQEKGVCNVYILLDKSEWKKTSKDSWSNQSKKQK